ncbi:MAG: 3-methyl-2-oxobutanoate hydroxymethyltransferase [Chloroflexi bacterium]|nr:3-methyl-2-oxobutanoate hydroxymethyltransferase [Chloroflexota bacterium]
MRVSINDIRDMKRKGQRIAMVTAYDYPTAKLVDEAGIPMILVGDSLGQVVLGYESTVRVTMEDMLHHIKAVMRGAQHALVIADMPFMSYQADVATAIRNAGRMLQEGGAGAVKLEGGEHMAETVRRIVECGIPVQGHIGLTPQSVYQLGGYKVQGRTLKAAAKLIRDAQALEEAGAFSIVLESVPAPLSRLITQRLGVPTIGIGAGPHCDGQVQVLHDMMGMFTDFVPKHAKRYATLGDIFKAAMAQYIKEVQDGAFPTAKESFTMDEAVLAELTSDPRPRVTTD